MREDLVKDITGRLKQFSDYLGDKKWFIGDEVQCTCIHACHMCICLMCFTFCLPTCVGAHVLSQITSADFVMYEALDELHEFEPTIYANYPTLKVTVTVLSS